MRTSLPIPAQLVSLLADSLLTIYGAKAEAVYHSIVSQAADSQPDSVRQSRAELLDTDNLLEQLDVSGARQAVKVSGERDVLAVTIYDALCGAAERLGQNCDAFRHGEAGLGEIADDLSQAYGLLRLMHAIESRSHAPPRDTAGRRS